jgi:hypothetical protein
LKQTILTTSLAEAFHEEAHARLSPSGSKKWFACPGSLTLEEPIPNVATSYSDDGTGMHDVAAQCLTSGRRAASFIGDYIVVSLPHEKPVRKVRFDEDMADLVQGYVDSCLFMARGKRKWVEQRVNFSEFCGVEGQFGTADLIVLDETQGELVVCDLKTGYTPVDVRKNSQLMCYALGALAKLRDEAEQGDDDADLF